MAVTADADTWSEWFERNYPTIQLTDEHRRCIEMIGQWQALYNIPRSPVDKRRPDGGFMCENIGGPRVRFMLETTIELSTWDFDALTSLVLAAHAHHCRVTVDAVSVRGPRLMITVWPREKDQQGSSMLIHPGLEQLKDRIDRHLGLDRHLS